MAPHGDKSDAAEEAMVAEAEKRPISTILIVMAMQTEALPVVNKLNLSEDLEYVFLIYMDLAYGRPSQHPIFKRNLTEM